MPALSNFARKKKIDFFINPIPKDASVLEIGSGSNWLGEYMSKNGWLNYIGVDIEGNPTIKGNIHFWKELGLNGASFDIIVAFEVVEHDDVWDVCHSLLKPGGTLLITTPHPAGDWILRILEIVGLNQKRTSKHIYLHSVKKINNFKTVYYKNIACLSQWAIFKK